MKLRVTATLLNKRKLLPVALPEPQNVVGQVNKGFEFEGQEVANPFNPDLGKWYKDSDGYFYWGGGLDVLPPFGILEYDPTKMSWGHKMHEIPFVWNDLQTRGKGAVVALIDTGIDTGHEDIRYNGSLSKSFVSGIEHLNDDDGHGTNMAGIIAGSGKMVYGVAPEVELIVVKGTQRARGVVQSEFANAINYVASLPEVDIISISYAFLLNNIEVANAIKNCQNKLVVVNVGNYRSPSDTTDNPETYPAFYNSGLVVGAHTSSKAIASFSNWNSCLKMLAPGVDILTTKLGNTTDKVQGTSIATAFTAGCLALMVSHAKNKGKHPADYMQMILDTCDDIGIVIGRDSSSGFGLINFRNAISKLK